MDIQEFMLYNGRERLISVLKKIRESSFDKNVVSGEAQERALNLGNLEIEILGKEIIGYLFYFKVHQCNPSTKRDLKNYLFAVSNQKVRECIEESYGSIEVFDNEFTDENVEIDNNDTYIQSVAVHPNFRGIGIGKTLMINGIKRAKECNTKRVYLNCWCKSPHAEQLYQNLGFLPIIKVNEMFPDGSAGLFMGLDLEKQSI